MNDIYYCRKGEEHPWAPEIDSWKVEKEDLDIPEYEKLAKLMDVSWTK